MTPLPAPEPRLDPHILEQAMLWMVRLQSGVSSEAEQLACQRWRQESAAHELAWQRLNGISQGLRESTRGLSATGARSLLEARSLPSRRAVLKSLAAGGVLIAGGYGVQQRSVLPGLFSDYATATGERRNWSLTSGLALQLDTRSALDSDLVDGVRLLTLNRGRVLLQVEQGASVSLRTADARVRPAMLSRLVVSQQSTGTLVQMLKGAAQVEHGQGAGITLQAGWQQLYSSSRAEPLEPLAAGAGAWTQGLVVAQRMPLAELLAELDRYRPGVLRCDPQIAGLQVSGSFSLDQPDASLELISQVLPVRVQRVLGYWASVVPA
ncbi:DUF4880 domain-containing protein [Pseudomonas sp. Irchel 3F5]|uniref:DUF4880 domain-containing protein n=1 Tax=Pseudomonas sp. Irchel 3F5 TaxID=2009002 RepID=UPI000BA4D026|nr:DUF4880 domain-containing protein [Pseudomonas sp. Irchel 3F5]